VLTVLIVAQPKAAFEASIFGLKLWFDVVFPALFPFFTMSEVLMGLGVIHFGGVLLEPAMRPLFRIPGVGGFVVAIGLASGYPLGAKMTGQVCRQGLCTPVEGERLVAFANTADPLYLIAGVSFGMFGMPEVGAALVASHYLAVLLVGLAMRFHAGGRMGTVEKPARRGKRSALLARALQAMEEARRQDARPIGQLFGDAVHSSLRSMLFIGGCIMMFSVFLQTLTAAGVVTWVASAVSFVLSPFGISDGIVQALIKGIVEITIGSDAAARATDADVLQRVTVASGIIAWSGLGVHAQVAAMVHGTGIRMAPYVFARFLHGVFAAAIAWLIMGPLRPALMPIIQPVSSPLISEQSIGFWGRLSHSLTVVAALSALLVAITAVLSLKQRVAGLWVRR